MYNGRAAETCFSERFKNVRRLLSYTLMPRRLSTAFRRSGLGQFSSSQISFTFFHVSSMFTSI